MPDCHGKKLLYLQMKKLIIFRNINAGVILITFIIRHFFLTDLTRSWISSYYSYILLICLICIIVLEMRIRYLKKKK